LVAYAPPDRVVLNVGASFRNEPMIAASERVYPLVQKDFAELKALGFDADTVEALASQISDLKSLSKDPRSKKNDTPLAMNEVAETMARARAWMYTLRQIAMVNLALDAPALMRAASVAPELAEGYPRDLLAELELRIEAARDMKPRLEECGLTDNFLGRGRTLARQLKTAIGAEDVNPENLHFTLRRLYMRKGSLYLMLKRLTRAGQLVFAHKPDRARLYHLAELEPRVEEFFRAPIAPAPIKK
jgi:hypothetical protein